MLLIHSLYKLKYMTEIVLDTAKHKGKQVLLLKFPYNSKLIALTKQLPDAKWSNTHKAWYSLYSSEVLHQVKNLFVDVAVINANILKGKLEEIKNSAPDLKEICLSEETKNSIEKFKSWMRSRRYSESTVATYSDALKTFLKFYNTKALADISNGDVIEFNNKYILEKKMSASFQNQVVNAIKLFFRTMQNTNMNAELIHRPKRAFVLPNVLSKEEVKLVLNSLSNIKHKAMLSLIYSCGLRRSELLNLKLADIDSKRNLIIIRQSKGRKDRIVPLSLKILELLREYFSAYKPKEWLFEGQDKKNNYDERSLASVLKQAVVKSKINKPVTIHWLRHSYATHLLESGTDLRYIQAILGHSRSTTTEIYTHVSNKSIQKIVSPFDNL